MHLMFHQVYLAGASLVTMYFMTGQGKALEDESLMTSSLLNILEFLDTLTYDKRSRFKGRINLLNSLPRCGICCLILQCVSTSHLWRIKYQI